MRSADKRSLLRANAVLAAKAQTLASRHNLFIAILAGAAEQAGGEWRVPLSQAGKVSVVVEGGEAVVRVVADEAGEGKGEAA